MSEYLTDEEQVARLRAWWREYGTSLVVALVLVVAGVVGWRWYESHQQTHLLSASDLYAQFLDAKGDARDNLAARIIDQGKGTAYPTFVLLAQAETAVSNGKPSEAEPLLQRAVDLASGEELADLARLRLARVLFQTDQSDEALKVLDRIHGEGYLSLAAELQGDIHLARGERKLAHDAYTTALAHVQPGDQRPVLEMKIADTADSND